MSVSGRASRRADVQGLRAVAVLLVVAFHADLPIPGGFVGVDVFFVISGFVITALILRQVNDSTFSPATFYARRIRRLAPAMALMILVVFVLALLFQSPLGEQQITAHTGAGAMFLLANIVILRSTGGYFDAAAEANPLLHTWSLSVEEQFYLVFPLLILAVVVVVARRRIAFPPLFIAIAAIAVVSFAVNVGLSYGLLGQQWTSQPEAWAFYLPVTRAWEFAAGALIAVWWHGKLRESALDNDDSGRQATALAVVGAVLLVVSALWINDSRVFPGLIAVIPVVGTTCLIVSGGLGINHVSRALSSKPMTAIGDMSYSIYLWHWPIIVFALMLWPYPWIPLAAAVFSFLPAYLAYRYVEQPIRHSARGSNKAVFAGYVAIALVVVAVAWLLTLIGTNSVSYAASSNNPTVGIQRGCLIADRAFDLEDIDRCRFTVADARGWILLTGDSHAESFSNAVITSGNALGYDVIALSGADCVFVRDNEATARVPNCPEMAEALLERVLGDDPPALVVSAQRGVPVGVDSTFRELSEAGIPVLRIEGVPQWRPWGSHRGPNPCSGGIANASCEISKSEVVSNAPASKESEAAAIRGIPGISSFDPWPVFCRGEICSAIAEGNIAYSDASHLNAWGSSLFSPQMQVAIQEAIDR